MNKIKKAISEKQFRAIIESGVPEKYQSWMRLEAYGEPVAFVSPEFFSTYFEEDAQ